MVRNCDEYIDKKGIQHFLKTRLFGNGRTHGGILSMPGISPAFKS
jgi:hypothetical protein